MSMVIFLEEDFLFENFQFLIFRFFFLSSNLRSIDILLYPHSSATDCNLWSIENLCKL